ncbi:MAG: GDP-mannose 4,6-dehydratase [Acidobacteria bacterium]|nr:GDP-mannose 4,6-dehydratase [Bryobacteraceae bacterium CoA2 C42]
MRETRQNHWQDRSVFITGGTGLVGSRLIRRLLEARSEVVCLMRDWVPDSELVRSGDYQKIKVVRGDVTDQAFLERALGEYEVDTVFHLAAQTIVGIANRNPVSTFEANIKGTWALLEACRRSPLVKSVVIASSDKAYGDHDVLPYDESAALQGRHPYDCSKSCADLISQCYGHSYGMPVAITRCGNFYGPGDLNWNRIIPGTIRSILRGEAPIIRSDGTFIRDYFFVDDGANAYMTLAEALWNRPELKGEAFNFSNELQITALDLVQRILAVMESPLQPVILNQAVNEIRHQYLSAEKARRMLQWKPLYDLDSALVQTVSWYRDYLTA